MMKYFEWVKALSNIYLEDSYVLEIREYGCALEFEMEFVLLEKHPFYSKPHDNEMHCYREGLIRLKNCRKIEWEHRAHTQKSPFSNNDFGNIDVFYKDQNQIRIEGDWGKVCVITDEVSLYLQV